MRISGCNPAKASASGAVDTTKRSTRLSDLLMYSITFLGTLLKWMLFGGTPGMKSSMSITRNAPE
ncbi:hypothetical protein D3C81_2144860 [compost metagenome]